MELHAFKTSVYSESILCSKPNKHFDVLKDEWDSEEWCEEQCVDGVLKSVDMHKPVVNWKHSVDFMRGVRKLID